MLSWLGQNIATGIVCLIIVGAVVLAVRQIIRNRRQGKTCCGNCSACSQHCKKQ